MKKLIPIAFLLLLLTGCAPATSPGTCDVDSDCTDDDQARAVELAKQAYQAAVAAGTDLSNGPCIANDLMPDWVADIAHSPRQDVDDQPENQCSAFREGRAHHFQRYTRQSALSRDVTEKHGGRRKKEFL